MAVEISGCQVRFARIEQVVQLISILNLLGCPADIRRILVCGSTFFAFAIPVGFHLVL